MEQIRDGTVTLQPAEVWAAAIASMLSHKLNHQQSIVLAGGLDAAYEYQHELCAIVLNGAYNLEKQRGDWIDWQELFYLCDPNLFLLTGDGQMQRRIATSPQGSRVRDLRDLLKQLGFTPRH